MGILSTCMNLVLPCFGHRFINGRIMKKTGLTVEIMYNNAKNEMIKRSATVYATRDGHEGYVDRPSDLPKYPMLHFYYFGDGTGASGYMPVPPCPDDERGLDVLCLEQISLVDTILTMNYRSNNFDMHSSRRIVNNSGTITVPTDIADGVYVRILSDCSSVEIVKALPHNKFITFPLLTCNLEN